MSIKKSKLKPRFILINAPSLTALKERLQRSQKDTTIVDQWIERARNGQYQDYQYDKIIMNDSFEKAYRIFRDFCISNYWKDFEESDV